MRSRFTTVLARFRDAETERAFRTSILAKVQKDGQVTLLVGAAGVAMFAISDYGFLGLSREFYLLLGIRATVVAGCLCAALMLRARDRVLGRLWLIDAMPALIATSTLCLVALRPHTLHTQFTAIVAVSMVFYLFLPILSWGLIGASLYMGIGFLIGGWYWADLSWGEIRSYALLLILANGAGYMVARRIALLRREQFLLLSEERRSRRRLIEEVARREALEKRLRIMAETDELTGLDNRRSFLDRASAAFAHMRQTGRPLSLCMIDVDNFKAINDGWGHDCGDRVLREVAAICLQTFRKGDAVGRFGGEEFVAALPGAGLEEARRVAERLRAAVAALRLDGPLTDLRVTVTIGITEVDPGETGLAFALKRADAALYRGKRSGRNVVLEALGPGAAEEAVPGAGEGIS